MFAIRVAGTRTLSGMIEANLDNDACGLPAGEVNISFMVQSWARGRGFATRAIELMCDWLEGIEDVEVAVLRIDPDNTALLGMASRARFEDAGRITTPRRGPLPLLPASALKQRPERRPSWNARTHTGARRRAGARYQPVCTRSSEVPRPDCAAAHLTLTSVTFCRVDDVAIHTWQRLGRRWGLSRLAAIGGAHGNR